MCKIEVENWSPDSHINAGIIEFPTVAVRPGHREMFVTHKTAYKLSGTWGTASWSISGNNKRAVVMWSCPFNFHYHTNWFGVGLTTSVDGHHDWFNQMYNESNGRGLNFFRGEYYYHTKSISINDGQFDITATMGTSHHATARVIVRPLNESELAPSIKEKLRKKKVIKLLPA